MMRWICGVGMMVLVVVFERMIEVIVSGSYVCWLVPVLQRSIDLEIELGGWISSQMACELEDV